MCDKIAVSIYWLAKGLTSYVNSTIWFHSKKIGITEVRYLYYVCQQKNIFDWLKCNFLHISGPWTEYKMYRVHYHRRTQNSFIFSPTSGWNFFPRDLFVSEALLQSLLLASWFTIYMRCIPLAELSRVEAPSGSAGEKRGSARTSTNKIQMNTPPARTHSLTGILTRRMIPCGAGRAKSYWPRSWEDSFAAPTWAQRALWVYLPLRADVTRKTILIEGISRSLSPFFVVDAPSGCVQCCLRFSVCLADTQLPSMLTLSLYCVVFSDQEK